MKSAGPGEVELLAQARRCSGPFHAELADLARVGARIASDDAMPDLSGLPVLGIAVALGCGLLIGLERERRKGEGPDRAAAGIRSFTIAALAGAMAQGVGSAGLVVAGAVLVVALTAVAYFKSRSHDPGLTTELALFATYLVGVQSVMSPALGAACGVGLAALLAARAGLHRFATRWLTEQELRDGVLLAALGLVVLPLIPNRPIEWLAGISPRPLAALVLLILSLQAAGHVALRWLGPDRGLVVSGFVSGFVSSTVTIATLGRRARAGPTRGTLLSAAAVLSTAATWVQVIVMSAALSPGAARVLAPAALAGMGTALAAGAAWWLLARRGTSTRTPVEPADSRALRPREALIVAGLLSAVTLLISMAQTRFGATGVYAGAALAGLADAHSPVASLTALHVGGQLAERDLLLGVLTAVSANSVTRVVVAFTAGGLRYGARAAISLAAGLTAAWLAAL